MIIKANRGILLFAVCILLISIIARANIFLLSSILLLIYIFSKCIKEKSKHIFFLLFLVAFAIFLMGSPICHDYFHYEMAFEYSDEDYMYLNLTVFLSLLFLWIGYSISLHGKTTKKITETTGILNTNNPNYNKITLILFYLFSVPWLISILEQGMYVQEEGYIAYYSFTTKLPRFITLPGNMCPYALCFFLGTYPSKRKARLPLLIVFLYAVLSLLVGRRMYFVVYILLIVGYLLLRNKERKEFDLSRTIWLTKRQMIMLVLMVPVFVVFLYIYKFLRYGKDPEADNLLDAFIGFFSQQGFTANLIPLGKQYGNRLSNDIYSFYDTIKAFRTSFLAENLLGLNYRAIYNGSRVILAKESGSFASAISYLVYEQKYLNGYGMGSCYIAELYHDFGFIGIALGNAFYGFFIGRFLTLSKNRKIKNAVALSMFTKILMLPRYNFDYPFTVVLSLTFWMYLAMVLVLNFIISSYKHRIIAASNELVKN